MLVTLLATRYLLAPGHFDRPDGHDTAHHFFVVTSRQKIVLKYLVLISSHCLATRGLVFHDLSNDQP